jgi:UDP-glucose 6-dehydrogenase
MSSFALLDEKISGLLNKYAALQAAHKKLQKECDKKDQELLALKEKIASTAQENTASFIAAALPDKKQRTAARKHIDSVIKEIDKILTRLDD